MHNENPDNAAESRKSLRLAINIAGETVQFDVSVPEGPATWEDLLPFMRTLIAVGSEISQEYFAGQGKQISCRAGCGICCRQRVPVTEFEAHRLRRLVESFPEPRRSEILARFRAAEDRIRAAGESVQLDGATFSIEEMTKRAANYFRLMIPCPFLENESCSIYDERPLKCREYLVVSPAEYCGEPEGNQVVGLPLPVKVFLTALTLDNDSGSIQPAWIPLTELLTWTDEHQPSDPKRTGPELLHEFMSRLLQPAPERLA